LFERGCFVVIVAVDQGVDALLAAGLIAVRVSEGVLGSTEEILRGLEDRGTIRRRNQFSGGEGI